MNIQFKDESPNLNINISIDNEIKKTIKRNERYIFNISEDSLDELYPQVKKNEVKGFIDKTVTGVATEELPDYIKIVSQYL